MYNKHDDGKSSPTEDPLPPLARGSVSHTARNV